MTIALDPRFAKCVRLMESTTHDGERDAARERAQAVATSAGMTFDQAMAIHRKETPTPPTVIDIFDGFDDWCEAREPGYKAARAAEKSAKERARLERRAAIIARYGSEEAALAPCAREQKIRDALGARIKYGPSPHQRWTHAVDGCGSAWHRLKPSVRQGVADAYPLPTNFAEARAEYEYWFRRRADMEDVLGDGYGDCGLDMTAEIRMDIVRDLYEFELPTTTLEDLHARFAYNQTECHSDKIEDALFRDLTAMLETGQQPSNPSTHLPSENPTVSGGPTSVHAHPSKLVADMLRDDPSRSDRDVARAAGCSPTTVGKLRREFGLVSSARSVQRGGRMYHMNIPLHGGWQNSEEN